MRRCCGKLVALCLEQRAKVCKSADLNFAWPRLLNYLKMNMHFLNFLGLFETVLLSIGFGTVLGISFLNQLRLLRNAKIRVDDKRLFSMAQRIAGAGLSLGLMALAMIAAKNVTSMNKNTFVLIALSSAILMVIAFRKREKLGA